MWTDPMHPVWKLIRLLILCVTLVVMLTVMYRNGFDPMKDIPTIIAALSAIAGFDVVKDRVVSNNIKNL